MLDTERQQEVAGPESQAVFAFGPEEIIAKLLGGVAENLGPCLIDVIVYWRLSDMRAAQADQGLQADLRGSASWNVERGGSPSRRFSGNIIMGLDITESNGVHHGGRYGVVQDAAGKDANGGKGLHRLEFAPDHANGARAILFVLQIRVAPQEMQLLGEVVVQAKTGVIIPDRLSKRRREAGGVQTIAHRGVIALLWEKAPKGLHGRRYA